MQASQNELERTPSISNLWRTLTSIDKNILNFISNKCF
jgi:hypothetical protein